MQITIIRMKQLLGVTGMSKSSVYRLIGEGNFPRQIQLSKRCVGFDEAAVQEWLRSRVGA